MFLGALMAWEFGRVPDALLGQLIATEPSKLKRARVGIPHTFEPEFNVVTE